MKSLSEKLAEIRAREYHLEKVCTCGTDVPKLLAVIEKLREQRDRRILSESGFHGFFNYQLSVARENDELAAILGGEK